MNLTRAAGLALLSLAIASPALAEDRKPFYLGAGFGLNNGRIDCLEEFKCDHTDKSEKLFGGWLLDPSIELQVTWYNAGHFNGGNVTPLGTHFGGEYGITGWAFTGGYRYALQPDITLIARGGVTFTRVNFDYLLPDYGSDKRKTTAQPYGGLTALMSVTPVIKVGLDYDLTRFKAHRDTGLLQTFGLSAQYAF
jgi:hypothetical protein